MITKFILKSTIGVISSFLLCNCATIFGGASPKQVSLESNPPGANVTVTNKNGEQVFSGVTPVSAMLKRSSGYFSQAKYTAEFSKKNYQTRSAIIYGDINPWYFGNIIFGGLIGILIVDPATGAMWTLNDKCAVSMGGINSNQQGKKSQAYNINTIPKEWRSHLVAVR